MHAPPKHVHFDSIYRPDFEVVEERRGNVSLYPHTDQLPLLHRALDLEFKTALPGHVARVDKRGDGFHKNLLKHAALSFCSITNVARPEKLRLMSLPDADLVTRVAIVQQITEDDPLGKTHSFKFYAGADFFPEVRLSGRRVVFADHVLQRFSARVPNNVGEDLALLLLAFFGSPHIALETGPSHAFIVPYIDSVLAFPFKMNDEVFFITTCLTVNEMNSLTQHVPPLTFNLHYGETLTIPRIRQWSPTRWMLDLHGKWERKVPLPPPRVAASKRLTWKWMAARLVDAEVKKGHGRGTSFFFWDNIPGPCAVEFLPGVPEPCVDERKMYHDLASRTDWDARFAEQEAAILPPALKPKAAGPTP